MTQQVRTSDCHSPNHASSQVPSQSRPGTHAPPVLTQTLYHTLASLPERARFSPPPSRLCRAPSMDVQCST